MQVTSSFGFMIKKRQIGDQIQGHNIGDFRIIQELVMPGLGASFRKSRFFWTERWVWLRPENVAAQM
jgi:hypothetical protein